MISQKLSSHLLEYGDVKKYPLGFTFKSDGEFINHTAFLLNGLIKINIDSEKNTLFLYFISDSIHNILSFMNIYENTTIKITATTLKETTLLWVSNKVLIEKSIKNKEFRNIIMSNYHYNNYHLLNTLSDILKKNIKERLFHYLKTRAYLYNTSKLKISVSEMALDLNTTKKNIYNILKKLEHEEFLQTYPGIILLINQN